MAEPVLDVQGIGAHRLRGQFIMERGQIEARCSCGSTFEIAAPRSLVDQVLAEFRLHASLVGDRAPAREHACAAPIGQCGCAYDAWIARQAEVPMLK